jgi:arginine repressor
MPPRFKFIPLEDIKGLKTLIKEGMTQDQMEAYYKEYGIDVDRVTISRRIKELGDEK